MDNQMSWPIIENWKCQTCDGGAHLLEWSIQNGVCYCGRCGTVYTMRDCNIIFITPVCLLKEEYKKPAKWGYENFNKPISAFTDADWDKAIEMSNMPELYNVKMYDHALTPEEIIRAFENE